MDNYNIIGEFITALQRILIKNAPELKIEVVDNIKADGHEALGKILAKYNLIKQ